MKNLTFSQKRLLTVFAFSVRIFVMGAEQAVIFSSIWPYLQMFNADYWYYGLVLSAYYTVSIASIILIGHFADGKSANLQFIAFLSNLAEIVGNTIYSLHFNMSLPLLGRIVAGLGEGYLSAIWAELARITTAEERTRYFALLKVSYLTGLVLGPALNLFLIKFDFYLGNWHLDFRTSPGLFMSFMWILVTCIMFVCVYDLSDEMRKEKGYRPISDGLSKEQKKRHLQEAYNMESPKSGNNHSDMTSSSFINDDVIKTEEIAKDSTKSINRPFLDAAIDIFTKFHVIAVVYSIFFIFILHSSIQAITPLVAENMLLWSEDNISLLFTIWGVQIVILAIILFILSPKIPDRYLLLISAIFGSLASVAVIPLASSFPMSTRAYYSLLVTLFLDGIAVTVLNAVGRSLVSKHTNLDNQGLVQAILSVLNRVALFTGPLIGSSLFTHKEILAIILSGTQISELVLVIFAFKKLKANPSKS